MTNGSNDPNGGTASLQSLERGLAVIRLFSADHPALTLSDVAREAGMTRATARRILLTLGRLGYVSANGRNFSLTPLVLELGYSYVSSLGITAAHVELSALSAKVQESSSIGTLHGTEVVVVVAVQTSRIMTTSTPVGSRLPAHLTADGRVLLAGLATPELESTLSRIELSAATAHSVATMDELRRIVADVRARRWALVDQELEIGVRSLAVPLYGRNGQVIAAIGITAHASRLSEEQLVTDVLPLLRAAAERIVVA